MKDRPACCMAYTTLLLSLSLSLSPQQRPCSAIMGDEGDITTNFGYAERRRVGTGEREVRPDDDGGGRIRGRTTKRLGLKLHEEVELMRGGRVVRKGVGARPAQVGG